MRHLLVVLSLILVSCGSSEPEAKGPRLRFRETVSGRKLNLEVRDCSVYDLNRKGARVLTTEFYPMITYCERQDIRADGEYVRVVLGRIAFGAGGCCATGGTYRSRDGVNWEKSGPENKWTPVEQQP